MSTAAERPQERGAGRAVLAHAVPAQRTGNGASQDAIVVVSGLGARESVRRRCRRRAQKAHRVDGVVCMQRFRPARLPRRRKHRRRGRGTWARHLHRSRPSRRVLGRRLTRGGVRPTCRLLPLGGRRAHLHHSSVARPWPPFGLGGAVSATHWSRGGGADDWGGDSGRREEVEAGGARTVPWTRGGVVTSTASTTFPPWRRDLDAVIGLGQGRRHIGRRRE